MIFPHLLHILFCQSFYINAYKYFIIPFIICLPFGKIRTRCECHSSWISRIKKCIGIEINCNGECISKIGFFISQDFALSIWVLKIIIFIYLFVALNEILLFVLSSYLLWFCTSLVFCTIAFLLIINSCSKINCITNNNRNNNRNNNITYNVNNIYIGNHILINPNSECCQCNCFQTNYLTKFICCCCISTRIIYIWLFSIIPAFPNNLWGGLFGIYVGTHSIKNTYTGGNRFIDFMSLSCFNSISLHSNRRWLYFINSIIRTNNVANNYQNNTLDLNYIQIDNNQNDNNQDMLMDFTSESSFISNINGTKIVVKNNYIPDNCTNYSDIEKNTCCICMEENITEYCEWISCNHCFCKTCTNDMITFKENCKFPCPICRKTSNTVVLFEI